jgi:hypothetical protein
MRSQLFVPGLVLAALALACPTRGAQIKFDVLAATPVGSWQVREQTTTKEDGSKRVLSIKTSMIGSEIRGGEPYLWVEMELRPTRIDKKGRVKEEPPVISKLLVRQWFFDLDLGNVLCNPYPFAQEIILQTAESEVPTRYYGKGLQKVGDLLGLGTKFQWKQLPNESVEVTAGIFHAIRLQGSATEETRALLRKVQVETSADFWYAAQIPFGQVKGEVRNPNGKPETWVSELKSFGTSGAVSQITQPPKDDTGKGRLTKIFGE